MRTQLVVATPSEFRREWYLTELAEFGFDVVAVSDGLECIERLREDHPDVLLLESSLQWGGADGILSARNEDPELLAIPVILMAVDGVSTEVYRLARFSVQGYYGRLPPVAVLAASLRRAVQEAAENRNSLAVSPR